MVVVVVVVVGEGGGGGAGAGLYKVEFRVQAEDRQESADFQKWSVWADSTRDPHNMVLVNASDTGIGSGRVCHKRLQRQILQRNACKRKRWPLPLP